MSIGVGVTQFYLHSRVAMAIWSILGLNKRYMLNFGEQNLGLLEVVERIRGTFLRD